MQVTRKFCANQTAALSTAAKNATCSRGWLRLVIQSIFAVLTTASFIIIVLMAVRTPSKPPPPQSPRCVVNVQNCGVVCKRTPYYGLYEDDILVALTHAETKCYVVNLELQSPYFGNNTLPSHWLARLRGNINQLSIIGGNLNHLPSTAFISEFTGFIRHLLLQDLHIKTWGTNSLVGLSSLQSLTILNCVIDDIQADSLRAVDNTLETVSITESGYWNPANLTGSRDLEKLTVVNFSHNQFGNILGQDSFSGLDKCEILYLNSCGITSIGHGAFDNLKNIHVLYLDFNFLVTVPPGLFASISQLDNPRPRVSLQENLWHCDCDANDLRELVRKDILLVEGICSYPYSMEGKTFTELENSCGNIISVDTVNNERYAQYTDTKDDRLYVNGVCRHDIKTGKSRSFNIVSPHGYKKCSLNKTNILDVSLILDNKNLTTDKYWVKFNFLLQSYKYNALQIGAAENVNKGLLWFQSECPNELYCIDYMPPLLRIYNIETTTQITFCPIKLKNGNIENDACVRYDLDDFETKFEANKRILNWFMWSLTALLCICLGAVIVYGLIRMNPILLKGSKRILFVKHKTVDALVLPPKIPLRNDLINDTALNFMDKEIFTLCANDKLKLPKMDRMKSIRSNKSSSPSYVSALQPSDEQLAEWRITHHFNNDLTITSRTESYYSGDTLYYSLNESDSTFISLK